MMRKIYTIILLCTLAMSAFAEEMKFSSQEQETRYEALLPQIRCMVCANQSVADSQSGFAQDMKAWLHDAIIEGRSDTEIRAALVSRFGESVLYSPMLSASTYVLWGLPLLLVLAVLVFWYRGTRS